MDSIGDSIKRTREKILKMNFKYSAGSSENANEVVDIIGNYAWVNDDINTTGDKEETIETEETGITSHITSSENKKNNVTSRSSWTKKNRVPYCYIVERESAMNASFANILQLINTLTATVERGASMISEVGDLFLGKTITSDVDKETGQPKSEAEKIAAKNSDSASETAKKDLDIATKNFNGLNAKFKSIIQRVKSNEFTSLLKNNNLNSNILSPYRFLYITKETGKKYVFPLATQSSSFGTLKNTWDGASTAPKFLNTIIELGKGISDTITGGVNFAENVLENLKGNASDLGYFSEIAKCFKYNTDGDRISCEFMLYNTTRLNAWKDNFKFLYLFYLRNLPIKIDPTTFLPPLLYDITIPGVKRLPVSIITNIESIPKGMIRTLTCDNFITNNGSMVANIPEAWQIRIDFQNLLGPAANMMLAEANATVNIQTEITESSS